MTQKTGERARLNPARRRNLATRQHALRVIRAHFDAQDFLEVDTPAMVPSPGLDPHLDAFAIQRPRPEQPKRFLHTSPEYQMKRLLAAGLERIYQIGKAFRQEERGHLHNPEFTMLEWYRATAGMEDVMADTERLVAAVATALHGRPHLPGHPRPGERAAHPGVDVTPPWPRLRVADAFARHAGVALEDVLPDEERFFRLLIDIEPELGRGRPTFLTHYPASMASLARLCPEEPAFAERFEVYLDGIELANGFGELTDPVEQRSRLAADLENRRALGKPTYPIDERFLAALEEGVPPSGGNALGIDRLIMLATGATCIDDVMAFTADEL